MKNHGNKPSRLDSVVKSSGGRYVERASSFDILVWTWSFVGSRQEQTREPPACVKWKEWW